MGVQLFPNLKVDTNQRAEPFSSYTLRSLDLTVQALRPGKPSRCQFRTEDIAFRPPRRQGSDLCDHCRCQREPGLLYGSREGNFSEKTKNHVTKLRVKFRAEKNTSATFRHPLILNFDFILIFTDGKVEFSFY